MHSICLVLFIFIYNAVLKLWIEIEEGKEKESLKIKNQRKK